MELIVIGSSNMDLVIDVPRIPELGETIMGSDSNMFFGGKGANQAVAAIRAGGNVSFITRLGKDVFGEQIKKHFISEGLPNDCIFTDIKAPPGIAQIWVSEKGENSIVVAPGANLKLSAEDVSLFKDLIINAKMVLVQLEIPLATIEYICHIAHANHVKVILNPAPAQPLSDELLSKIWILTPNESETELLTQQEVTSVDSAVRAGRILLKKGVENALITLGEKGSLLCNNAGFKHYKSYKEIASDSTAAGDVFNGALAVALTEKRSFEEAIPFASAAAAISVTRKGAQPSAPYKMEIEKYQSENKY